MSKGEQGAASTPSLQAPAHQGQWESSDLTELMRHTACTWTNEGSVHGREDTEQEPLYWPS